MAPSATETVTAAPAAPTTTPAASLKLYGEGSGDYKELAPQGYEKATEEGKGSFPAAKVRPDDIYVMFFCLTTPPQ